MCQVFQVQHLLARTSKLTKDTRLTSPGHSGKDDHSSIRRKRGLRRPAVALISPLKNTRREVRLSQEPRDALTSHSPAPAMHQYFAGRTDTSNLLDD